MRVCAKRRNCAIVNFQTGYWIGCEGWFQLFSEKSMSDEDDIVPLGQFQ